MKKIIGCASIVTLLGMGITAYAAPVENWVSLSLANLPAVAKIGETYSGVELKVTNPNSQTICLNKLLDPQYPAGFTATSNTCQNISLAQSASCEVTGNYIPENVNQNIWSTRVAVEGVGWQKIYSTSVVAHGLDLDAKKNANKMIAYNGDTDSETITVTNNSAETLTNLSAALVTPISGLTIASQSNAAAPLAVGASRTFALTYVSPTNSTNVNIQRDIADIRFTYGTTYATETLDDKLNVLGVKKGYYISLPVFDKGSSTAASTTYHVVVKNEGKDRYLGTPGGLSISHDGGASYRSYTTNDGLAANAIRTLDVSTDGQLIAVGTTKGLSVSTDGGETWATKTSVNGLGSDEIAAVKIVNGKIFAATYGGLSTSTNNGQTFQTVTTSSGLGNNYVYALAVSADGQSIVAGTYGGLSISTDGGQSFINKTTAAGLSTDVIIDVAMSADGQTIYVVGYYAGVDKSTDGGASFTHMSNLNVTDYTISHVATSSDGQELLVAAGNGLAQSADGGQTVAVKTTANGLGSDSVLGVTYDNETGDAYAATFGGLSELAQGATAFTNTTSTQGLAGEDLRSLLLSPDGAKLFVGSYDGGLDISTNNGFEFSKVNDGLASPDVLDLAQSADGQKIYAGMPSGLSVSADGGATFTQLNSLCGDDAPSINGLYVNPITGKVYAGVYYNTQTSYVNALAVADSGMVNPTCLTPQNSGLPNDLVMGVSASNDDQKIYLATNGGSGLGISTDAGQTFTMKTTSSGLGNNNIENVQIANDGQTVYAATGSGLGVSTDGGDNFTNYTTASGLASDSTRGVLTANNGQTWYVPQYGGLSVSHDGGATFATITTADGLGSDNVRMPVLTQDGLGMYVPTELGLYYTKFAS